MSPTRGSQPTGYHPVNKLHQPLPGAPIARQKETGDMMTPKERQAIVLANSEGRALWHLGALLN
ncbi:MAG: hypothetical protein KA170_18250, partial [Candidatus Promineofilum sp.]|nr:hypothetical protein [Promineifilum sp.]